MRIQTVFPVLLVGVLLLTMSARTWSAEAADPLAMRTGEAHAGPSDEQVLEDFAEQQAAVFGSTVFPPDTRVEVADTTKQPYRTVAFLLIYDKEGHITSTCSGVFVSPNVVLTAAHCLYKNGSYYYSIVAAPGANVHGPVLGLATAARLAVPAGWADGFGKLAPGVPHERSALDFGLVMFDGDPFGGSLAPYPVLAHAPDEFFKVPNRRIGTVGFPGDKPFGSMWSTDSFEFFFDDDFLISRIDIVGGQSGSPIYAIDQQGKFIMSVVNSEGDVANLSVRFTPAVLKTLESYCVAMGCSISTYTWVDGAPSAASTVPAGATLAAVQPTPIPTALKKFHVAAPFLSRD